MKTEDILATETSKQFHTWMDNRMLVSFYKYGPIKDGFPSKVNALESLKTRIDTYLQTGNKEYLVDAANFCMIEFIHPAHPNAYLLATDAERSPGRTPQHEVYEGKSVSFKNSDLLSEDEKV